MRMQFVLPILLFFVSCVSSTSRAMQPSDCDPRNNPYTSFDDLLNDLLDDPLSTDPGDGLMYDPDPNSSSSPCNSTAMDKLKQFLDAVCKRMNRSDTDDHQHDPFPGTPPTPLTSYSCSCDHGEPGVWTPEHIAQAVCAFLHRFNVEPCSDCADLIAAVESCLGTEVTPLTAGYIRACAGCGLDSELNCTTTLSVVSCGGGTCLDLKADLDAYSQCLQQTQGRAPSESELVARICQFYTSCTATNSINYCDINAACLSATIGLSAQAMEAVAACLPEVGTIATPCSTGCDTVYKHAAVDACDVNGDGHVNCDDLLTLAVQTIICQQEHGWDDEEIDWCGMITLWMNACNSNPEVECACSKTVPCISYLIAMGVSPEALLTQARAEFARIGRELRTLERLAVHDEAVRERLERTRQNAADARTTLEAARITLRTSVERVLEPQARQRLAACLNARNAGLPVELRVVDWSDDTREQLRAALAAERLARASRHTLSDEYAAVLRDARSHPSVREARGGLDQFLAEIRAEFQSR